MRPRNPPGNIPNPLRDLVAIRNRAAERARARRREPANAQSTEASPSQLEGRVAQMEQITVLQTETLGHLSDSARVSEQKVSALVGSIEKALGGALPGFRLTPPSHMSAHLNSVTFSRELVNLQDRSIEYARIPNAYCPRCTSENVRRSARTGMWEEFLRLFFIAPFRCRACRYKFYRF